MNINCIEPEHRAISIVALIQSGVVTMGTLFVAVVLKYKGYHGGEVPDSFFNSNAIFVRQFGFVLLVLPIIWAVLSVVVSRKARSRIPPLFMIALGIAAILLEICGYIDLCFNPYIL